MPTRPVPDQDRRTTYVKVNAGNLAPPFRRLAETRGTGPSVLLRDLILRTIEQAYGYEDTTRRQTPRNHGREPNPDSPVITAALSPTEGYIAAELAAGPGTMNAWLRSLIETELEAEGIEIPPAAIRPARENPARTAALARLADAEWPEDAAARTEQIRHLHAAGDLDGLSYADIGKLAGVTRQRVAQILKPHKEET